MFSAQQRYFRTFGLGGSDNDDSNNDNAADYEHENDDNDDFFSNDNNQQHPYHHDPTALCDELCDDTDRRDYYAALPEYPPLDMEEQKRTVHNDRLREHVKWCDSMLEQQRMSLAHRRIAMKILVNEAYVRDKKRCVEECNKRIANLKKEALVNKNNSNNPFNNSADSEEATTTTKAPTTTTTRNTAEGSLSLSSCNGDSSHWSPNTPPTHDATPSFKCQITPNTSNNNINNINNNTTFNNNTPNSNNNSSDDMNNNNNDDNNDKSDEQLLRKSIEAEKARGEAELKYIRRCWEEVAQCVTEDMECFDNSALVLKNLSCMCVFIPSSICREYGDNLLSRQERVANMREMLQRMEDQGVLFLPDCHNNNTTTFGEEGMMTPPPPIQYNNNNTSVIQQQQEFDEGEYEDCEDDDDFFEQYHTQLIAETTVTAACEKEYHAPQHRQELEALLQENHDGSNHHNHHGVDMDDDDDFSLPAQVLSEAAAMHQELCDKDCSTTPSTSHSTSPEVTPRRRAHHCHHSDNNSNKKDDSSHNNDEEEDDFGDFFSASAPQEQEQLHKVMCNEAEHLVWHPNSGAESNNNNTDEDDANVDSEEDFL